MAPPVFWGRGALVQAKPSAELVAYFASSSPLVFAGMARY